MVDKYRGIFPRGSIWFSFSKREMTSFLKANPGIIPPGEQVDPHNIDGGEIQAIDVERFEAAIVNAGLSII